MFNWKDLEIDIPKKIIAWKIVDGEWVEYEVTDEKTIEKIIKNQIKKYYGLEL